MTVQFKWLQRNMQMRKLRARAVLYQCWMHAQLVTRNMWDSPLRTLTTSMETECVGLSDVHIHSTWKVQSCPKLQNDVCRKGLLKTRYASNAYSPLTSYQQNLITVLGREVFWEKLVNLPSLCSSFKVWCPWEVTPCSRNTDRAMRFPQSQERKLMSLHLYFTMGQLLSVKILICLIFM